MMVRSSMLHPLCWLAGNYNVVFIKPADPGELPKESLCSHTDPISHDWLPPYKSGIWR